MTAGTGTRSPDEEQTATPPPQPHSLHPLVRLVLQRFWFVHTPVTVMTRATPLVCVQTLATAARPSSDRLHHRNLFASGRRYELSSNLSGTRPRFRIRTTSKVSWHYRRRTRAAAVMDGVFFTMPGDITRIQLATHISVAHLLEFTLLPTFITSIIVFVPWWQPAVIAACVVALYTLSWIAHRNNAALEANEMIFFVQKALEDLEPARIMSLDTGESEMVIEQQDFAEEWDRFYRQHSPPDDTP